ncbi:hypothetical protein [Herbaspirillum autotrophicum]|uniref:hypothetical protein n=1 Tax=Herbaspirillum autotrophicum TaxID=180195 RepID=UPI000A5040E7|nr:hypothetical protein [Herbaspirillum autotrophicum]
MQLITESTNPERDSAIIEASQGGAATKDIADLHKISVGRVQQILRRHKAGEVFDLFLADGQQKVGVAQVITSRGFIHACQLAMREYRASFARLELPSWRLVAGENAIALNDPSLAG